MHKVIKDILDLSDSTDRAYQRTRADFQERVLDMARMCGLSRSETGEILLDAAVCIILEEVSPVSEDFEGDVAASKKSFLTSLDHKL